MTRIIKPPTKREYQEAVLTEMSMFAPEIKTCQDCGWPVVSGYCCGYCGSSEPYGCDDLHYHYALSLGKAIMGKVKGLEFHLSERATPSRKVYWEICWAATDERGGPSRALRSAKVDWDCNLLLGGKMVAANDPQAAEKLLAYVRRNRRKK